MNTEIDENIKMLKQQFRMINKMGWIKSCFRGCGAAGSTFEKLLGKPVENSENPDFLGIEIKTHKEDGKFPITLFRATPSGKIEYQIKYLVENFGYYDKNFKDRKILGGVVTTKKRRKLGSNYSFQLKVDEKHKILRLFVSDKQGTIVYQDAGWDFTLLEKKLKQKLSLLCYIKTERKYENKQVYFKYNKIDFYSLKKFNSFIDLLKKGYITVNFSVYIYQHGIKYGKIYDHGTSFRIFPNNISKLFNHIDNEKDDFIVEFQPFDI